MDDLAIDTCGRCDMPVVWLAPQVAASTGMYHRECFEAWYFGHHGRRPRLVQGTGGERHRYRLPGGEGPGGLSRG